jgi:hypothetical protein
MTRHIAQLVTISLLIAACGSVALNEESANSDSGEEPIARSVIVPDHLLSMQAAWNTDFGNTIIDLNELLVGIPASDPRDAIPPIDGPQFEVVSNSDWIDDREPGVLVEMGDDARFYPLSILTRHEIVNDQFGDMPLAVTYCPLCNTAMVFDRRFGNETLRLGVSGLLRNSDLVMWDDLTHTLWQQITGEAIVGEHAGESLTPVGSAIVRWLDFKTEHPEGQVLAREQGFGRVYGNNPYEFYSSRPAPYGFFTGELDPRYPALERVVGITVNGASKAYPFSVINEQKVVNDIVGNEPVVVFWGAADTADALDSGTIADSIAIGTAIAYSPIVNNNTLTFEPIDDIEFRDVETGTTWSILGKATAGELEGQSLEILPHRNEFWFAWQAFFPDAEVWVG